MKDYPTVIYESPRDHPARKDASLQLLQSTPKNEHPLNCPAPESPAEDIAARNVNHVHQPEVDERPGWSLA